MGISRFAGDRAPVGRLPELDGLRGIAAAIVLLYHSSLVARPFLDTNRTGDAWWWITETPLKLLTAGTESVLVFFVLSGLVVALPALNPTFSWRGYFATRFLRLYLPVWGALVFAAALVWLIPRDAAAITPGAWIDVGSVRSISLAQLFSEATLGRVSYDIDNVLWSLRWELVFSAALPLFVLLAVLTRRAWIPVAAVAGALTVLGRIFEIDALVYLPVFFLGTLLAVKLPDVLPRLRRTPMGPLAIVSLLLLVGSWLARGWLAPETPGGAVLWGLAGVGAVGVVLVALGSARARGILSSRFIAWLGRVSFSLYLVHVPVLQTVTYLLGDARWYLAIPIAIALSLGIAQLFFVAVERPAHRAARAVGAAAVRAPRSEPAPRGQSRARR